MRVDAVNQISQVYNQPKTRNNVKADKAYGKDKLQISQTAKDYQTAKQAVKDAPDVRMDKVEQYKEAIVSGTYNVSSQEIAEKMVSKYFDALY